MLSRSKNVNITGGTFNQISNAGKGGFERLENAAAPAAFHDSADRRDPPRCHPNTRIAVTEKIMAWILGLDLDTRNALIMWIYGPAGSGKSAIAQTIAERCADQGILLASFFFYRSDSTRNHPRSLIPTIVYQIATHLPTFRERVVEIIDADPHIFNRSLAKQMVSLIIEPLQDLIPLGFFNGPNSMRLIIVDGLDECEDHGGQLDILRTISESFQRHHLPLIFLIVSRPEYDITNTLGAGYLQEITSRLALDSEYQASADIRLFLRDEFAYVKESHPLKSKIPADWPTEEVLDHLVYKSSGQFIYAATVTKFVKSTRHRPPNRLDIILGLHSAASTRDMPFTELDVLYRHIFLSVQDLDTVLLILAWHIITRNSWPGGWAVDRMEAVFSLNPGETRLLFCDLPSVIEITTHELGGWESLHFFHASLEDFLLDKSRSRDLHIDPPQRSSDFSCILFQLFPKIPSINVSIRSIFEALEAFMKLACPNAVLRQEIMNFNITQYFHTSFGYEVFWYMPSFINFVKGSKFVDAHEMAENHTQLFEQYAISQLEAYYSDPRLLSLLAIIGSDDSDFRWVNGQGIRHLLLVDHRLRSVDQNGLGCLPMESLASDVSPDRYFETLASFLNDKARSGKYALDGVKYAPASLYVLRYTSNHSSKHHQLVAKYANRNNSAFKDTPWKWRLAKMRGKAAFERMKQRRKRCRSRHILFHIYRPVSKFQIDWVRQLCGGRYLEPGDPHGRASKFGLDCLPKLLSRAGRSEELIDFARRRSFGIISAMFRQEAKTARQALVEYLKRMEFGDE